MKINKSVQKTVPCMGKKKKYDRAHWELASMVVPGVIYTLLFSYLPMMGVILAFKDFKFNLGMFGSPWVGLNNFKFLFASNTLQLLLRNTICYNLVFIFLNIVCAVFAALCLNTIKRRTTLKIYQTAALMPNFVSWIVVTYIVYALLAPDTGIINNIITSIGGERISFYSETKYWPLILIIFNTWKHIGYNGLIYYGTILGIDETLFEAAALDGCSEVKKVWYITLPHLKTTIITLTLLSLGGILTSDFGLFYYVPRDSGTLYPVTDVLTTYVNRAIRSGGSLNNSSAVSFLTSVVGFVLVVTTNLIVKKIDPNSSLF